MARVLAVHSRRLPTWAVPVVAGRLFTAAVAVSLTSAGRYRATQGTPR